MQQPAPARTTIDIPRFRAALALSQIRFALLKERYPRLRGWLVLSNSTGQTDIGGDWLVMLGTFPGLFHDTPAKSSALALLNTAGDSSGAEQKKELEGRIEALLPHMQVDGTCRVEIRFNDLDYDLIWKLQADELVDQQLTQRSRASIRIVLGTISDLACRGT